MTLYDPRIPSAAPIFTRDRKIISIDGGCVLKADGQLNALILPVIDVLLSIMSLTRRTAGRSTSR